MRIINKMIAAYEIGGIKLLKKKILGYILRRDMSYKDLYNICKSTNPKDYPHMLELCYSLKTGKRMDINNPITFNEKIQWLKLHDSTEIKTRLADKYHVRDFVKDTIGEEYLIPLLGVWKRFDDIDFDKLPERFVLKANHGSGWNIVVKDKSKLDIAEAKKKFDRWMNLNFAFCVGFEMHYKDIKPLIIAEEYMSEADSDDIEDYKIHCYNGTPRIIQVDYDRFLEHKRNIYSTEWEYLDVRIEYPTDKKHIINKPEKLNEMLDIARKLSKDFIYVRVDLYYINNRVYFGEMTFSHGAGYERFVPEEFGIEMGKWAELPLNSLYQGSRMDFEEESIL